MYRVRFGSILVDFREFQNEISLNTWQYKLDPYRVNEKDTLNAEIVLRSQLFNDLQSIIDEKTHEVSAIPFGIYFQYIHQANDGNLYVTIARRDTQDVYLMYKINPHWNAISLIFNKADQSGHIAFEYLGSLFPYCLLQFGTLTFHGVFMEYQGKGMIISAPSGTGKTTHARLWRDHKNALIINGDRATCQKINGEWVGFGLPWSGTSGEQVNRSAPLVAFVVLERAKNNKAFRINGMEAFGAVLPHLQCPTWDVDLSQKAMDLLDDFLNHISIIRLQCLPDKESVEVLNQVLEDLYND